MEENIENEQKPKLKEDKILFIIPANTLIECDKIKFALNCTFASCKSNKKDNSTQRMKSAKNDNIISDKVYKFMHCSCVFESGQTTISVHRTKKGAYEAMRRFLIGEHIKWFEDRLRYGKGDKYWTSLKVGIHEAWTIQESELLD